MCSGSRRRLSSSTAGPFTELVYLGADHVEFVVAMGGVTFESGGKLDSVRVTLGVPYAF